MRPGLQATFGAEITPTPATAPTFAPAEDGEEATSFDNLSRSAGHLTLNPHGHLPTCVLPCSTWRPIGNIGSVNNMPRSSLGGFLQILDEQKRYIQAAKNQPTEPHRFRTLAAQTENLRSANHGNRGRCCDPKTPTHTASTLAFCIERHHHTAGDGRGSLESPRCREGGGRTVPLDGRQALRALGPPDPRIDPFLSE